MKIELEVTSEELEKMKPAQVEFLLEKAPSLIEVTSAAVIERLSLTFKKKFLKKSDPKYWNIILQNSHAEVLWRLVANNTKLIPALSEEQKRKMEPKNLTDIRYSSVVMFAKKNYKKEADFLAGFDWSFIKDNDDFWVTKIIEGLSEAPEALRIAMGDMKPEDLTISSYSDLRTVYENMGWELSE